MGKMGRRDFLGLSAGAAALAVVGKAGAHDTRETWATGIQPDYEWPLLKDVPDMSARFSEKDWLEKGAASLLIPIDLHRYVVYSGYLPSEDFSSIQAYRQVVWLTRRGALCADKLDLFVRARPRDYSLSDIPMPQDYAISIGGTGVIGKPATGVELCVFEGNGHEGGIGYRSLRKHRDDGLPAEGGIDWPTQIKYAMFVDLPDFYGCEDALGFKLCWEMMPGEGELSDSRLDIPTQYDPQCERLIYRERMSIGNLYSGPGHVLIPKDPDWNTTYKTPNKWPFAGLKDFRIGSEL